MAMGVCDESGYHTSYKRKGHSNLKLYRRTILHQLIPVQGKVVFSQGKRMRKEKKKKEEDKDDQKLGGNPL